MKHLALFLACAVAALAAFADEPEGSIFAEAVDDGASVEAPTDAAALLAAGLARLPRECLALSGTLSQRKRYGSPMNACAFDAVADFRAASPSVMYLVRESQAADAKILARVAAQHDAAGALVLTSLPEGDGTCTLASPAPADRIAGTDITWLDAGLDFLWWTKDPALVGTERVKGRLCDLVEVSPSHPIEGCARARLWIDRAQQVALQAAQLDAEGTILRRLWVRGLQKVDGRWMVKDIEVEPRGAKTRTRLHFDNISVIEE